MALKPYVAPYNYSGQNYLNQNWNFSAYPTSPGNPTGWTGTVGTPAAQKGAGGVGVQLTGSPSTDGAIANNVGLFGGPGWYIVEYIVTLNSGTLVDCGASVITFTDATLTTSVETANVMANNTVDVNGNITPSGSPGTTYHFRALVQFSNPASAAIQFRIGAHLSGGVETEAAANQVTFLLAGVRPATLGEIAAGNQVQNLPVFPSLPGLTPEIKKAPTWSTNVAISTSGVERRTSFWAYPRWTFELAYEVIRDRATADELEGLWELFNTCQGKRYAFLFLDPTNYVVTGEQFGTGDGTTTAFQLTRAVRTWTEPLLCPFGVTVYVNGTATTVTLNAGGSVVFASAPAVNAALTWAGYFFYPCRFDQDDLTATGIMQALWASDGLKFISVKNLT